MLVSRDEFSNKMVLFNEHLFICISMINQQVGDKPYKIQGIDVRGKTQTIAAFDDPEIAEREFKRLSKLSYPHEIQFNYWRTE